jgi:hypothetical protein
MEGVLAGMVDPRRFLAQIVLNADIDRYIEQAGP